MTAADILAIPTDEPERLFTNEHALKAQYHKLVKEWHPDRNPTLVGANEVLRHIGELYARAEGKSKAGTWAKPNVRVLLSVDGKKFEVQYKKKLNFELGEELFGSQVLTYLVRKEHAALYNNAQRRVAQLTYPDAKLRKGLEPYFPRVHRAFVAKAEGTGPETGVWALQKPKDVFPLRSILEHYGGKLDPRHVAWVISSLQNLACGLELSKLSHNGISLDTVFVSPAGHAAYLLGGWWYATQFGEKFTVLPKEIAAALPRMVKEQKSSNGVVDQVLIRHLGLELLGDPRGLSGAAPKPMMHWLTASPATGSVQNYLQWTEVRKAAFGPRKFIPMNITTKDIFPG